MRSVKFQEIKTSSHVFYLQITVKKSGSDNVLVISLNQAVFTVEKKIPEIEE